jgi:hypothetical protein
MNLVKYENGDVLADSQKVLNRWKNYFSQLLNLHSVGDVKQMEVHMAERPSHLEVKFAIAKLKKYKLQGNDEIPAELIQAGGETLMSAIHKHVNCIWNN